MRLGRALRVTAEFKRTGDVRRSASGARYDALVVFVDGLQLRISAIVDAGFSVIADGVSG